MDHIDAEEARKRTNDARKQQVFDEIGKGIEACNTYIEVPAVYVSDELRRELRNEFNYGVEECLDAIRITW